MKQPHRIAAAYTFSTLILVGTVVLVVVLITRRKKNNNNNNTLNNNLEVRTNQGGTTSTLKSSKFGGIPELNGEVVATNCDKVDIGYCNTLGMIDVQLHTVDKNVVPSDALNLSIGVYKSNANEFRYYLWRTTDQKNGYGQYFTFSNSETLFSIEDQVEAFMDYQNIQLPTFYDNTGYAEENNIGWNGATVTRLTRDRNNEYFYFFLSTGYTIQFKGQDPQEKKPFRYILGTKKTGASGASITTQYYIAPSQNKYIRTYCSYAANMDLDSLPKIQTPDDLSDAFMVTNIYYYSEKIYWKWKIKDEEGYITSNEPNLTFQSVEYVYPGDKPHIAHTGGWSLGDKNIEGDQSNGHKKRLTPITRFELLDDSIWVFPAFEESMFSTLPYAQERTDIPILCLRGKDNREYYWLKDGVFHLIFDVNDTPNKKHINRLAGHNVAVHNYASFYFANFCYRFTYTDTYGKPGSQRENRKVIKEGHDWDSGGQMKFNIRRNGILGTTERDGHKPVWFGAGYDTVDPDWYDAINTWPDSKHNNCSAAFNPLDFF